MYLHRHADAAVFNPKLKVEEKDLLQGLEAAATIHVKESRTVLCVADTLVGDYRRLTVRVFLTRKSDVRLIGFPF